MRKIILVVVLIVFALSATLLGLGIGSKIQKQRQIAEKIQQLPSFSFSTLTGKSFSSSEIRKGPVLIIRFHPECEHCQYEITEILKSNIPVSGTLVIMVSSADKDYYKRVKTPLRGVILSVLNSSNQVQYDEINAQFSWQIGAFTLSLEKMNNVWGYGRNGTVIFSDNAPSYPQIKLRVPLSNDIDFVYFHGELNSNVVDSSRSYFVTYPGQAYSKFREVDHSKYIAAHQLEISLWHGVDFSIGESIVYSDRGPLLMYLIPIMFFKAGEHYNNDKDNCQLFGSLDLNVVKNVNAYLSLFIDELNTDKLFDPNLSHRQVAFTSGIRVFDIPATNFDMTLEYTRVNPATYNHSYPSTTFTNNGFILGSWMGQNADDLFLEMGLTPMHSLRLTTFGEIYRKGGMLPLADQYSDNQGNWTFLFGPLHVERSIGLTVKYQPLRDVFINCRARLHKIEDEADPIQNRPHQFEFTLGAGVGLW